MAETTTTQQTTKVVTGLVRFSYLHIFKAAAIGDSTTEKYSASLIIRKDDKTTLEKIKAAVKAAQELGKSDWGGRIPAKLKLPLRDGDEEKPDDEAYKGCYFLNANSIGKPGIVDKDLNPILDQDEVYSGCYGRASINFYPFDVKGNKGVGVGLNNLQKMKDGEPLGGGRSKAEDDFSEAYELEDDDFMN